MSRDYNSMSVHEKIFLSYDDITSSESRSPTLKKHKTAAGVSFHSRSSSESCINRSRSPSILHSRSVSLPSPITSPDFQYIFDSDDDVDENFVNLANDLEDDANSYSAIDTAFYDIVNGAANDASSITSDIATDIGGNTKNSSNYNSHHRYKSCPNFTQDSRDVESEAPRQIADVEERSFAEVRTQFPSFNNGFKSTAFDIDSSPAIYMHDSRSPITSIIQDRVNRNMRRAISYPVTPGDQTVFSVVSRDAVWNTENHEEAYYFRGNILLALPEDEFTLNELHCFIRENVEAFTATEEDVASRHSKGVQKLHCDQVGVRCIHCKNAPIKDRANQAVSYPSTISGISQTAFDMQRHHFGACKDLPIHLKTKFFELKNSSYRKRSSRWYWIDAAKKLGLVDTQKGIRFTSDPRSIVQQQSLNIRQNGSLTSPKGLNEDDIIKNPLVLPEDKPLITDFLELVMKQMLPCQLTEECGRHTDRPLGFPGLACMHCFGPGGFGKYFPSTPATLKDNNTATRFYLHMLKCRRCPSDVKQRLAELHQKHATESARLKLGSKKKFFHRVWNRLHGSDHTSSNDKDIPDLKTRAIAVERSARRLDVTAGSITSDINSSTSNNSAYYVQNNNKTVLEEMDDWLSQVMPFQKSQRIGIASTSLFAEL